MRDENRIDEVLKEIGELWHKLPDMRLGQLICNVITDPALYYVEDKDLVEYLKKYYDFGGKTDEKN